jgi:Lipoprotein LpqB beta-propeller domain/Sporulation and spore germination
VAGVRTGVRTGVRRVRRGAAAALVAAGVLVTGAGCVSIPSSSPPQVIPQPVPTAAPADDDLRYDEIVPRPGEAPEDIVSDFIRSGGSIERGHPRARAYLTRTASSTWKDTGGTVIIDNAPYLNVGGGGAVVDMTAQRQGRLADDGSYVPDEKQIRYSFQLMKVDGNWRIKNPPPGLMIESGTFEAAYRPYEVYFLNSTRTKVVPDIRWYAAPPDSLPTLLVAALERGPSQWLEQAVLSDLQGVTLQNNIEQEADRVKVYLTGLDESADTLPPGAFAQLVWTLNQVGVGGVEVYAEGTLITPKNAPGRSLQRFSDWRGFDPNGLSATASGYFVRGGAVWTTKGEAIIGPAGRGSFRAVSVAASTDERSIAVVQQSASSRTLYLGAPGRLRVAVSGSSLTRPTWGAETREVWTVRDGREVLLMQLNGQVARVDVPQRQVIGTIRALSLSRDGSRVAVVAGPSGRERLWVGVVAGDNGSTQVQGLRPLDTNNSPVSDVSWAEAVTVIALTRAGEQDSSLYSVDVDGGSPGQLVPTAGLPGPPTGIAAGPSLPLLTIAAGSLWQAPVPSDGWSKAADGSGESAPAYPG